MQPVLCKACGESHGDLDDYDDGDTLECACGSEYKFETRPDSRHPDHLKMFNVTDEQPPPEVERVVGVDLHDGKVLWKRKDGPRVRDWRRDFPGDEAALETPDTVERALSVDPETMTVRWEGPDGLEVRTHLSNYPGDVEAIADDLHPGNGHKVRAMKAELDADATELSADE